MIEPKFIGILVLGGFSNLTLAALIEPLRAANRMAKQTLFGWQVASEDGKPVLSSSWLRVEAEVAMAEIAGADMLFVVASFDAEARATPAVRRFLRAEARRGTIIAGLESAPYVLALAGVLDGHRATTHWEDLRDFAERFPAVTAMPDRFVVDRRRITAGGALPTLDLMLDLLRREQGLSLALAVSSTFLYEGAHPGHDPQHMVAAGRLAWQDPLLVRAIRLMEANIEAPLPVEAIAAELGIGPRALLQRFRATLGTGPKAYYAELRLALARRLLENTDRPVNDIAADCGFASGSALARAFRTRYGVNPAGFRKAA
ncbi:GlxA family transcriptional regulator [Inquilinus sp.]|uniref:GlxA family transcriptional regulator n=1 Tax=Inquilinus sp. TaxID=1932117 RepID=UPI0031D043D4